MSVRQVQREVSSAEFSEWIAYYAIEAELNGAEHEPSPDELGSKLRGWAEGHNARVGGS